MNNPWDKYVTSWSKEPGGMVQASTERWVYPLGNVAYKTQVM